MANYRVRPGSVYGINGLIGANGQQTTEQDLDEYNLGLQASTFHTSQNAGLNTLGSARNGSGAVYNSPQAVSAQPQMQPAYSSTELHRFSQGADRYTTNRTGHWAGSTANFHASAVSNGTVGIGGSAGDAMAGYTDERGSNSNRGSQSALLSVPSQRHKWPKGKDFLFSTWAFVIGAHSLWEFPVLTLKYGGVVFILVYLTMFLILGAPMLLLEMALGQYGGLAPTKLFRNLCPGLTGVGFAQCASCVALSLTNLAVVTWSCQAIYNLFTTTSVPDTFFNKVVLDTGPDSSLSDLGLLHGQLALALGVACIVVFIFIAAGTRSIGKVSMLVVPLCYGLLMTLTIRGCMGSGGPEGILALLAPEWGHITRPWVWLEAAKHVFVSLQLGVGVVSTYSSYNKYHHNIIRDAGVIVIGHFVWTILSILLVFSLLGVADHSGKIIIKQLKSSPGTFASVVDADVDGSSLGMAESLIAKDFWLIGITLAETALGGLDYNWLWSGLLFCLITLTVASTVMGLLETLGACVVDEWPSMRSYKPAIVFTLLSAIFMTNLVMATKGGIHVYYLLTAYYAEWPLIFFGLLTVVGAAYAHGGKYLMKDIGDMSKMPLTHYISAHLSVLYASVIPIIMAVSLGWCLYGVALEHTLTPLANFSMALPMPEWGMALGWSLTFVPILCTAAGLIYHLLWRSRGIPIKMHLKRSFKPTDTWYENEHRELMQLDPASAKDSPVLAFRRGKGNNGANGNITEV